MIIAGMLMIPHAYAFDIPTNDGFVTDVADILSDAEEQQIEQILTQYQKETTNEIAVLTVPTLDGEAIVPVGVDIIRAWGIGTEENDNGILILIDYTGREMAIVTGYGLEGAVPDIVAGGIIRNEMTPLFRDGKYAEGILLSIDSLEKHIGGEYTAERYDESSDLPPISGGFIFFLFIVAQWMFAILARTKSWWLGGVFGAGIGGILTAMFSWWLTIPLLAVLGLILDFFVSKAHASRKKTPWWAGGYWGPGGHGGSFGGRGSGGFGGFGGGSAGGGGASGRW